MKTIDEVTVSSGQTEFAKKNEGNFAFPDASPDDPIAEAVGAKGHQASLNAATERDELQEQSLGAIGVVASSTFVEQPRRPGAEYVLGGGGVDKSVSSLHPDPAQEDYPFLVPRATVVNEDGNSNTPLAEATPVGAFSICCPYGSQTAIAPVLGLLGVLFSVLSLFTCFVNAADEEEGILYGYNCLRFVPCSACGDEDPVWKFGKVMTGMCIGGGIVVSGLSTALSCLVVSWKITTFLGIAYLLLGVMSLVVLIAKSTDQCDYSGACEMGPGMKMAIVAFALYTGAGISMFLLAKKRPQDKQLAPLKVREDRETI